VLETEKADLVVPAPMPAGAAGAAGDLVDEATRTPTPIVD
jgi:hypothetical protein